MKNKKCYIWWCDNKHYALGLCKAHWAAYKRYGSPYGKNPKNLEKMDGLHLSACLVALGVTEFVEKYGKTELTETLKVSQDKHYTWEVRESSEPVCPFCLGKLEDHSSMCIYVLSKGILEYNKTPHERKNYAETDS